MESVLVDSHPVRSEIGFIGINSNQHTDLYTSNVFWAVVSQLNLDSCLVPAAISWVLLARADLMPAAIDSIDKGSKYAAAFPATSGKLEVLEQATGTLK